MIWLDYVAVEAKLNDLKIVELLFFNLSVFHFLRFSATVEVKSDEGENSIGKKG